MSARRRFPLIARVATLVVVATASCSDNLAPCENTDTCDTVGGRNAAGTFGGKDDTPPGGNSSSGSSNAGEGGVATGGSSSAGNGGSLTAAGEAGAGGAGGVVTVPCDGACTAPKAVCDEPNDTCVECLEEGDCAAGAKKKCDTTAKACVECLAPVDCTDVKAAKCDTGACAKCTSNDDCAHVAGKGVCDAGTCVQCTAADESACGGKSCNPATRGCTTTPVGSVGTCRPCLADSECAGGNVADPDARCVPMKYNGTLRPNGFCLRRASKTCARPYKIAISAVSLSGEASESYCGIDQDKVRCEAVLDLVQSRACGGGMDSECGCSRDKDGNCTDTGISGLCRTVGVDAKQCTYQCGIDNHCPDGLACLGSGPSYCQ